MLYHEDGVLTVSEQGDKVRITKGYQSYACDLRGCTNVPLPYGDGRYTVDILTRLKDNRYKLIKRVSLEAKKTDGYLLQPNLYVPFTPAWEYAREITDGKTAEAAFNTVCGWAMKHLVYDYIKSFTVSRVNVLPDPFSCWKKRMGICQDIASLVTGMLRAAQIPAKLVIGRADNQYHAWTVAVINGKNYRFDRCGTAKTYKQDRCY